MHLMPKVCFKKLKKTGKLQSNQILIVQKFKRDQFEFKEHSQEIKIRYF